MGKQPPQPPAGKEDHVLIWRPYITLPNGQVLHAYERGIKAFPIWVKPT